MSYNFDEKEQTEKLKYIFNQLSLSETFFSNQEDVEDICSKLDELYSSDPDGKFRHCYSLLFPILSMIDNGRGDLNILLENIRALKGAYCSNIERSSDNKDKFIKLYDHTTLEILRINYNKRINNQLISLDKKIDEKSENLSRVAEDISSKLGKNEKRQDELQRNYISILGIFSSIVLAFTAGTTFSNSVLQNINSVSVFRLIIISLIIAFFTYNIIWVLIDFLRDVCDKKSPKALKLSLAFNVIIIIMMVLVVVGYFLLS